MSTVIAGLPDRKEETILVVGNGFDLYHGLKTQYYDFVQYTKEKNPNSAFSDICRENSIIKYFQKVVDKNDGWIDCEECIFRQNSTSVPEGRHAIPLQTACLQLMFIF